MKSLSKKSLALILTTALLSSLLIGCRSKEVTKAQKIELVYYKLYDNQSVFDPLIQNYQKQNPNVKIKYRKFTNPEEYERLIINELAEGEGPDIFSVPNTWIDRNFKKIIPANPQVISAQTFKDTFVSVASNNLVKQPSNSESELVYGIPLTVDTLALFYNKDHFEDKIPERGKPATTWEGIKEDVFKLTKQDASFERFEISGLAFGRSDNISRAVDILYLLFLQSKVNFYNQNLTQATFAGNKASTEALELFTSFGLPANKNYSWNQYIADPKSNEKEIAAFARGKVSMFVGYSFAYQQIKDKIADFDKKGLTTITPKTIKVAPIPQIFDPESSNQKRDTLASFQVEVIGRNSQNPNEAWKFLTYLSTQENLRTYAEKTNKPTSRRDLIAEQKEDPIYGVFVNQIGYAESIPIYDPQSYQQIFEETITSVINTQKPSDAIKLAQEKINKVLSSSP